MATKRLFWGVALAAGLGLGLGCPNSGGTSGGTTGSTSGGTLDLNWADWPMPNPCQHGAAEALELQHGHLGCRHR